MRQEMMLTALAAAMMATPALADDVDLTLNGVQAEGGNLLITLQSQDQFMQRAQTSGAILPGDQSGTVKTTLSDVPPGEYAISVLQDSDGNWDMTLDPDNRPAEGWAMTGNPPKDRKPVFDDVKFTVPEGGEAVILTMDYPGL